MRRGTFAISRALWATAPTLRFASTEASDSSTAVSVAPTATSSSSKKGHIVTSTTLHAGETPKVVQIDLSEHEAPRLKKHVPPQTFITPRAMRDFTFSVVVGCSIIAGIHYILSSSIADNYEEEVAVLRRVTNDTSEADKVPEKPSLPTFVAPSSYSVLKKKMDEETRIARERYLDLEGKRETPVLHREFWQRIMFAWNNSLSSVEQSACAVAVQYHDWRVKRMKQQVKRIIEAQQLTLVEMKQVV